MTPARGDGRTVRALLTGVGGGGHGEQVLKALRLADTNYEIVGTDLSPSSMGLFAVDYPLVVPPATAPEYIDVLLDIAREHDIEVVLHGSEPELRQMSAHRERFSEAGLFLPINPREVIDTCMDKVRTMQRLQEAGFPVPPYRSVRSIEDLDDFDELPVVLKPSVGGGGSAHLYLAQNRGELLACAEQLLNVQEHFIVQAYVGLPEDEYTVGVLLDMDGELLNSIAVRRDIMTALSNRIKVPNRSGRDALGPTLAISSGVSQGRIGRFEEVTGQCEEIAVALGARGPLNIQCRLVEGRVVVFEINPRFSGTTSLRAMVGYNEPDVLVRKHLLGESVPRHFPYGEGTIVRGLAETLIPDIDVPRVGTRP
jgi:carbamoyl-phosphate synthase large subunit